MERIQKIQKVFALRIRAVLFCCMSLLLFGVFLSGCSTTYRKVKVDSCKVGLTCVQTEIPESELLNVRIKVFDPGEIPTNKDKARGLSEEIREAESKHIAVQLKNTLQQTGIFGAVRVGPAESPGDEVLVTGCILKSNGEELELEVDVCDATGKQWLEEKYKGAVNMEMYEESLKKQFEVFQNVYNRIANEMVAYRQTMTSEQVQEIRRVAEMRFAEDLAPSAFTGYLQKDEKKGKYKVDRLPSEDDEMLARVRSVRERDYMLTDTIDGYYEGLHRKMIEVYTNWRKTRLAEMNMIREVDAKRNKEMLKGFGIILAGAVVGAVGAKHGGYNPAVGSTVGAMAGAGVALMIQADKISEEAEINKAALEELGTSFGAEVEPTVVEVEGKTVQLTGSAEAKYEQWRAVLGSIYEAETEGEPLPYAYSPPDEEAEAPVEPDQNEQ